MWMPKDKWMGDASSSFLCIDILLKKRDITIQEYRKIKFRIVAVSVWHGRVHENENQDNLLKCHWET